MDKYNITYIFSRFWLSIMMFAKEDREMKRKDA